MFKAKILCPLCGVNEAHETNKGDFLCNPCLRKKQAISSKSSFAGVG